MYGTGWTQRFNTYGGSGCRSPDNDNKGSQMNLFSSVLSS